MGGCPVHSPEDDSGDSTETNGGGQTGNGVGRRQFVKSALLIGGTSAVASLGSVADITPTVRAQESDGIGAAERLNRQHAWNAFLPAGGTGNHAPPENSVFLVLDYDGSGEPTPEHRREVARALSGLEDSFEWNLHGLMFTMAYSSSYFDRFDEEPPAGANPDDPEAVVDTVQRLTNFADTNDEIEPIDADALLLMASNNAANLLAAESALWGESDELSLDGTFEGVFERPESWPDRGVGFAGGEFQNRQEEYQEQFLSEFDESPIPGSAPLSMGFVAGFGASVPEEDAVTLTPGQRFPAPGVAESKVPTEVEYVGEVGERDPGMFAQGTLKHFAHLNIDLSEWYGENDSDRRRHQMLSPYHTEAETNDIGGRKPGSGLTDSFARELDEVGPDADEMEPKKTTLEYAEETEQTAAGEDEEMLPRGEDGEPVPIAGHSQKVARARYDLDGDGELEQPVLRRDWDIVSAGDDERPGYLFNIPMRFDESVYTVLDANYNIGFTSLDGGIDHDPVDSEEIKERSGIAPFLTATRRGHWLVPPITLRALPHPRAVSATVDVEREAGTYRVELADIDARDERRVPDPETARFGSVEAVNQARGVEPVETNQEGNTTVFRFDAESVGLSSGESARLFARLQDTGEPVAETVTVPDTESTDRTDTGSRDDEQADPEQDDSEQRELGQGDDEQSGPGDDADGSGPGFGIPAGLAGLGTAAYALKRRLGAESDEE